MLRPRHAPHGRVFAQRLVGWQRWAFYASGLLLMLTGVAWLAVHYAVGAGAGELPHPAEAWSLRLHGLGVLGALFVLGALAASHVPHGWRLTHHRRWAGQRRSGMALCVLCGALVLSGYLLYYFASEAVRPALGWAHAAAGIGVGLVVAYHRRGRGEPGARRTERLERSAP